ncbi:hypothetical protein [Streptococcus suis]|uniref:hypothetical protein n=1 Tax=Streptococcus suis TaxID=1307 RepID=UPI000CF497D1|nr:hypothetical protein [Streptococcus suis]
MSKILNDLVARKRTKTSGKEKFSTEAVYLGVEPREHFPFERDASGNKIKKEGTNEDLRSSIPDGHSYTLSEVGTSKLLKIVAIPGLDLKIGGYYTIEGLGYDMSRSNMIFIDEDVKIDELDLEVEL